VCGPEKLLAGLEDAFSGKLATTLHMERFHPKEIVLEEPDHEFEVYCTKSDVEFTVAVEESILMAADFAGVEISGDCMEGTCGACETTVIEGDVSHRDSIMTSEQQKTGGTMMICVSRARGQRITLDL
jgi:ferredoxin